MQKLPKILHRKRPHFNRHLKQKKYCAHIKNNGSVKHNILLQDNEGDSASGSNHPLFFPPLSLLIRHQSGSISANPIRSSTIIHHLPHSFLLSYPKPPKVSCTGHARFFLLFVSLVLDFHLLSLRRDCQGPCDLLQIPPFLWMSANSHLALTTTHKVTLLFFSLSLSL